MLFVFTKWTRKKVNCIAHKFGRNGLKVCKISSKNKLFLVIIRSFKLNRFICDMDAACIWEYIWKKIHQYENFFLAKPYSHQKCMSMPKIAIVISEKKLKSFKDDNYPSLIPSGRLLQNCSFYRTEVSFQCCAFSFVLEGMAWFNIFFCFPPKTK